MTPSTEEKAVEDKSILGGASVVSSFLDELEAEVAEEAARNAPRRNTPKSERRRDVKPTPTLSADGTTKLGHTPRPRKRGKR